MSHGYPVSSWPFRLMEPRSRPFAAWETQSTFIPSRRRSFNMGRCSVVSVEWSSLFLTRVFLAIHRCCTRQIKEKGIVNGRNILVKSWKHPPAWSTLGMSVLLFAIVSCSSVPSSSPTPTVGTTPYEGFITRIFTGSYGMQMTYYLYIPAHLDPQKKYPLVLLLHGGSERAKVNNTPIQNRDVLLN